MACCRGTVPARSGRYRQINPPKFAAHNKNQIDFKCIAHPAIRQGIPVNEYLKTGIQRYRSIFISDFHMGAKSFDAPALLDFLKSTESEYLYLVGDIIDGWKLKKRWYWTEECNCIFDELARKVDEGTKLIYVPGNHDETVRIVSPLRKMRFTRRLNIKIRNRVIHKTTDKKRILVIHGDQFDHKIIRGKLSRFADGFYDFFIDLFNVHENPEIDIKGKIKKFSLAKALSKPGKWALYLLNNFETVVYRAAKFHAADGIICGHTHIPTLKNIKDVLYGNCGSWLRGGHTALVEQNDGTIELLDWPNHYEEFVQPFLFSPETLPVSCRLVSDSSAYRPVTNLILSAIRKTWPDTQQEKRQDKTQEITQKRPLPQLQEYRSIKTWQEYS